METYEISKELANSIMEFIFDLQIPSKKLEQLKLGLMQLKKIEKPKTDEQEE